MVEPLPRPHRHDRVAAAVDHRRGDLEAARLPAQDKLSDGGKGILKAVARSMLPREVIDRPKGYFPVPMLKYLSGPTLEWVKDTLHSPAASAQVGSGTLYKTCAPAP